MPQAIPSSNQYTVIRVERVRKKLCIRKYRKVKPKLRERNGSTAGQWAESHVKVQPLSSRMFGLDASNNYGIPLTTKTSFWQRKVLPVSNEIRSSNVSMPNENSDSLWKYALVAICGILGIVLLGVLLAPSIIAYILALNLPPTDLTQLSRFGNYCAGVSPYTLWQIASSTTLTMIINTSACNFPDIPIYFVTVGGANSHYCLTGYDAIYLPTSTSFQVYINNFCSSLNSTVLLTMASSGAWRINWMGFLYQ